MFIEDVILKIYDMDFLQIIYFLCLFFVRLRTHLFSKCNCFLSKDSIILATFQFESQSTYFSFFTVKTLFNYVSLRISAE